MSTLDTFVEDCLVIIARRPSFTLEAPLPRQGSLWHSRLTGRRAVVLWASGGRVCLSYDETRINARKIHCLTDFTRLYTEAI